jgi:hypothetical protein
VRDLLLLVGAAGEGRIAAQPCRLVQPPALAAAEQGHSNAFHLTPPVKVAQGQDRRRQGATPRSHKGDRGGQGPAATLCPRFISFFASAVSERRGVWLGQGLAGPARSRGRACLVLTFLPDAAANPLQQR